MNARKVLAALSAAILMMQLAQSPQALAGTEKKGLMLMYRIGPSASELYVANADGSGEHKLLQTSVFDYDAAFSNDGNWVVFTSERDGLGQSNIYRAHADGTGIQRLTDDPAVDDAAVFSPDASRIAFVSTRAGGKANIWTLNIASGALRNVTGAVQALSDAAKPAGFFRPAWSPDGQWLAFSSDRNTAWRGHDAPFGWERTQELSIYVIKTDGTGFRRIASRPGYSQGSPSWSADGKRVVFYESTTEQTWGARRPELFAAVSSQIVSVDVATGGRTEHTSSAGYKVAPQYLSATNIAYQVKGGPNEGVYYTSGQLPLQGLRSVRWSHDGSKMIYQRVSFAPRPQNLPLYSWDPRWNYQFTDVFPALSRDGRTLVFTRKSQNSSIDISDPDGANQRRVYDADTSGLPPDLVAKGLAGAFNPAWSPDGQWIAFGLGEWFQLRRTATARIMRIRRDGTGLEALTDGTINAGFPSYSADGNQIVYRIWSDQEVGLRILNLTDRTTRVLTTGPDNLPGWSPDGSRIVFTRKGADGVNFDVFTIKPDGTNLRQLTTYGANDGHAVWTADGKILYSSGEYGFRDEVALYENTFQPDGQNWLMNADGSGKRPLTDSRWEDAMPLYAPYN